MNMMGLLETWVEISAFVKAQKLAMAPSHCLSRQCLDVQLSGRLKKVMSECQTKLSVSSSP